MILTKNISLYLKLGLFIMYQETEYEKKILYILSLFALCITFAQCSNDDEMSYENPDVKVFVQQVKTNKYDTQSPNGFVEVPNFKKKDIPVLLKYAKDTSPIQNYPACPYSSVGSDSYYRLTQCLLWTVEKIRVGTYPSVTPRLYKQENEEAVYVTEISDIMDVWNLYNKWWKQVESVSGEASSVPYQKNPLEDSKYSWR